MKNTNIIGVDFSGAKSDQNTWLAQGVWNGSELVLSHCRSITRSDLTDLLANSSGPAIAALDFPFSVPVDFARMWAPQAQTMPDLWAAAADMELDQFILLRDQFVRQHGEPKRLADTYFPESYSCLHQVNPNMVPMTFRGMQMLHQLWPTQPTVPPLGPTREKGLVLLEAMPGAALRAFGLPYKGYKNGARATELRQRILDHLAQQSSVPIRGLAQFTQLCLGNHDSLDSVVASVVAALWCRDPGRFRCPPAPGSAGFDPLALLEGWLYAPVYLHHPQ